MVTGDFGKSIVESRPARDAIGERLLATLELGISAFIFSALLGIPLGILGAVKRDGILDQIGKTVALIGQSAPSFIGIGIQPPTPSWGNMLTFAQLYVENGPHIALVSGITIAIVVLSVNLVGDALRDALDPRLRGSAEREYR